MNWLFGSIYTDAGRKSIPPERLIRVQLLQVLYSIRGERQLVEQINYNLLYRWFVGLAIDDSAWNQSTFSINRNRLLQYNIITELFEKMVGLARKQELLPDEHFSVDGTLVQVWALQKSYRCKDEDREPPAGADRNSKANFHGKSAVTRSTSQKQTLMRDWKRKVPINKPGFPI